MSGHVTSVGLCLGISAGCMNFLLIFFTCIVSVLPEFTPLFLTNNYLPVYVWCFGLQLLRVFTLGMI